jgi:hypothetical protein
MRVCNLNVVGLEREVVGLVDYQREVFVIKVLSLNLSTTSVSRNTNLWLFNDTDGITLSRDFTKVI